jgi:hypothetical protein
MSGQIALDPDAGFSVVDRLGSVEATVAGQRGAVLRPPSGFPPGLAATTAAEQASIMGGLEAGRGVTMAIRADLAHRTMMFVLAGGGTMSRGRMGQLLRIVGRGANRVLNVHDGWGHVVGLTKLGARGIGNAVRRLEHKKLFTAKSMDRWLGSKANPTRPLFKFISKVNKVPVVRGINFVNNVKSVVTGFTDAYKASHATSSFGKITSTVLAGGLNVVEVAKAASPVGLIDWALGNASRGAIDSVVTGSEMIYHGIKRDGQAPEIAERYTEDVRAGKAGWFYQAWAGLDDGVIQAVSSIQGDQSGLADWSDRARQGKSGPVLRVAQWGGDEISGAIWSVLR